MRSHKEGRSPISTHTSAGSQELRITLSQIAQLARVQRPVVSMWRSRSKNTSTPFPAPVATRDRQELFDAVEVITWLAATGRGNNPKAAQDVAAYAEPLISADRQQHFAGLTALLALRCLIDAPLASLTAEDLLDAADEQDPDDDFLYAELAGLGPDLLPLASHADLLTDAAYTAAAAFEQLYSDGFRAGTAVQGATWLTPEAMELLAATAVELALRSEQDPVFIDDGGSSLLPAVAHALGETTSATFCVGTLTSPAARLARRRMQAHGSWQENLHITNTVPVTAPWVRLAQFPSPVFPVLDATQMLTAIDNISLDLDEGSCAVVIAPASVLTDALQGTSQHREAESIRSDILRSDRVRAMVRLPQGLLPTRPRQAQALWVLGAADPNIAIADRWTMVADASEQELSVDVIQDLVGDLAASLGGREHIRAHSFRFATLMRTRSLLAHRGRLTAASQAPAQQKLFESTGSAAGLVRAETLLDSLRNETPAPLSMELSGEAQQTLAPTTIAEAMKTGALKYLPGHRILDRHVEPQRAGRAQFTLIGAEEVGGNLPFGSRTVSQLLFAGTYPQGRLTEPGDVIFTTGAQTAAVVDPAGAAVVLYPARVLRINAQNSSGLIPDALAQDLGSAAGNDWRRCPVRRIHPEVTPALSGALAEVAQERQRLAVRLQKLDELAGLLVDGAVQGSFTVLNFGTTMEGNS